MVDFTQGVVLLSRVKSVWAPPGRVPAVSQEASQLSSENQFLDRRDSSMKSTQQFSPPSDDATATRLLANPLSVAI